MPQRPPTRWLEIAIEVPSDAGDALGHWLFERGAPGVIEEPAPGERVRLRAHFDETSSSAELVGDARRALDELDRFFPGCAAASVALHGVDEEDWAESWKQGFPPLEVGRTLRVRPPWEQKDESSRHDVVIEPARAFGTGQHASTLGCLLALEEIAAAGEGLSPALDVGTGSGILAIGAARLGADRVLGIDVDPVAVEAAAANVERNGLGAVIELRCSGIEAVSGRFRLILANLYSGLLRGSFDAFAERAEPGAWLIVAGLLDADRDGVAAAASVAGWREGAARSLDGWTALTLGRGH